MQNLVKCHRFIHKILNGKEILTIIMGNNSVVNLRKFTRNNPNPDLVMVNAYAKFGLILLNHSQDIERKQNADHNKGS